MLSPCPFRSGRVWVKRKTDFPSGKSVLMHYALLWRPDSADDKLACVAALAPDVDARGESIGADLHALQIEVFRGSRGDVCGDVVGTRGGVLGVGEFEPALLAVVGQRPFGNGGYGIVQNGLVEDSGILRFGCRSSELIECRRCRRFEFYFAYGIRTCEYIVG